MAGAHTHTHEHLCYHMKWNVNTLERLPLDPSPSPAPASHTSQAVWYQVVRSSSTHTHTHTGALVTTARVWLLKYLIDFNWCLVVGWFDSLFKIFHHCVDTNKHIMNLRIPRNTCTSPNIKSTNLQLCWHNTRLHHRHFIDITWEGFIPPNVRVIVIPSWTWTVHFIVHSFHR